MKLTFVFLSAVVLGGCLNQSRVPQQQTGFDGKTYEIKGGGFATKDAVVLYKTHEINNLVGGCPSVFGLTNAQCFPQYLTNHQVTVRPVMDGQHPYEAIGNNPVGIARFERTNELVIPLRPSNTQAKCFVVTAQNGAFLPVRDGKGQGMYTFSNPLYKHREQKMVAGEQIKQLESNINFFQLKNKQVARTLERNRAFSRGTCVLPKQKALPSRPRNPMSKEKALFNANGFCFTLLAVRHSVAVVNNAMDSIGEFGMFKIAEKWRQNPPPSCSKVLHSQLKDTFCRPGGGSAGSMLRDWNRSCLQDLFKACKQKVLVQCGGQMDAWRAEVRRIKNEPLMLKNQCKSSIKNFKYNDKIIQDKKAKIKGYQYQKQAPKPTTREMVDLKTATCS